MKRFLLLASLATALHVSGKMVVNPAVEVSMSGIRHITAIETTPEATRVTLRVTFLPKWGDMFSRDEYLKDCATGIKYRATALEGGKFDTEIYMGPSGDSTFVLVFPPLPATARKVDYGVDDPDEGRSYDFELGVSLTQQAEPRKEYTVPPAVQAWIRSELAKDPVAAGQQPLFLERPSRIIGYIKGHDPRMGFTTGIIYATNGITGERSPSVLPIRPDGRFEGVVDMINPAVLQMAMHDAVLQLYLEPGSTLAVVLDWDDFLDADRMRNQRPYQFKRTLYEGVAAEVNRDLLKFSPTSYRPDYSKRVFKTTPEKFLRERMNIYARDSLRLEATVAGGGIAPKSAAIMRGSLMVDAATDLMDFLTYRLSYARRDSTGNSILRLPVPAGYLALLRRMPLDDPILMTAPGFPAFIDQFESSTIYLEPARQAPPRMPYRMVCTPEARYLEQNGVVLTDEQRRVVAWCDSVGGKFPEDYRRFDSLYRNELQVAATLWRDNASLLSQYLRTHFRQNWALETMKNRDKIFDSQNFAPSLARELVAARSAIKRFSYEERDFALEQLEYAQGHIRTPFIREQVARAFAENYPDARKPAAGKIATSVIPDSYALPKGPAADILRGIAVAYGKKTLIIDIWGTSCAPCIAAIKATRSVRERYRDDPRVALVYLTSETMASAKAYDQFVREQGMYHSHRLGRDDYNHLEALFRINSIPRCIVLLPDGKVLRQNYLLNNPEAVEKVIGVVSGKR